MGILRRSGAELEKRPIADALRKRYPGLSAEQVDRHANEIVRQVADAIRAGKNISFIELVDGDIQIDVISLVEEVASEAMTR